MPGWGGGWGTQWGPLSFEVGAPEGVDRVAVDDSTRIVFANLFKIFVGPTRLYTTIQDALDDLAANLVLLAISPLDVTRIICVDPGVYPENVVIPATILPTATARLIIRGHPGTERFDPRQVIVDGSGSGDVFLVQNPFVEIETMTLQNAANGVRITSAGDDVRVQRNILQDLTKGVVCETGGSQPRVTGNIFQRIAERNVEVIGNAPGIRVEYNSMLLPAGSLLTPSVGIFARTTGLQARNNIIVARGTGAVSIPVDFDDGAGAFAITSDFSNLFRLDDAGPIYRFNGTDFATLAAWQGAAPGQDANSISDDPDFVDVRTSSVRLRLRLDTPSHRAATFISDLLVDLFGGYRPQDLPSQGAIEPMNVILDQGRSRVLELLGGLSTDYVDRALAGQDGTISLLSPEATDRALTQLDDQIFERIIQIESVSVVGAKVNFDVTLGPSPKLMAERLDQFIDPLSEIGLAFKDQLLFTRLTIRDAPLEPLAPVTTRVSIGIEFV
jgi:hypothetical protein